MFSKCLFMCFKTCTHLSQILLIHTHIHIFTNIWLNHISLNQVYTDRFAGMYFRGVSTQCLVPSFKFRHCYSASCSHLYADLWLPGDRCVWNKHLPGCTEVAPWQWVSGCGSEQRVHASTHSLSWRNGDTTWACMNSSRQLERLRECSTTGSWLRRTLFCLQDSISFKS